MTTNRLAQTKPAMTLEEARSWHRSAQKHGSLECVSAWARYVRELEFQQGPDGKTLAAGQ
jgi:hypothetical protein